MEGGNFSGKVEELDVVRLTTGEEVVILVIFENHTAFLIEYDNGQQRTIKPDDIKEVTYKAKGPE